MATSAGTPGAPNEDFVGAVPGAVVLLDGAGIPGAESVCSQGVAWYTHRLGGAILGRLSQNDGRDLAVLLAAAIGEIADDHRDTCDLTNVNSPQATVAIVRTHRGRLDYLLLADTFVVLDRMHGGPLVITDEREVTARRICSEPLSGLQPGTAEYELVRDGCAEALRARRNQPDGYWLAKDDPRAAAEAVIGSCPLRELAGVALLSNGASRIIDPYGLTDWPGLVEGLGTQGPADIIGRVRRAEAVPSERGVVAHDPDDATVAYVTQLTPRAAEHRAWLPRP